MRCCNNHCFYIEKAVDARFEAGLNELRWSIDSIWDVAKTIVFYYAKAVEARIEAALNELRWDMKCCEHFCFNEKTVQARIEAGLMNYDGASMAYEMLQKLLLFLQ